MSAFFLLLLVCLYVCVQSVTHTRIHVHSMVVHMVVLVCLVSCFTSVCSIHLRQGGPLNLEPSRRVSSPREPLSPLPTALRSSYFGSKHCYSLSHLCSPHLLTEPALQPPTPNKHYLSYCPPSFLWPLSPCPRPLTKHPDCRPGLVVIHGT